MKTDLIVRAAAPAAGLGCLLAGAPQAVTGGFALLALALAADRLAALRRTGPADRLLVGVGGALVVLVLTGVVLDATGIGLRPVTWAAALVALGALGLLLAGLVPPRAPAVAPVRLSAGPSARRTTLLALPWVAAAVVVTVLAVRTSTTSLDAVEAAPLEMSLGTVSGTSVEIVVRSSDAVGPLELRTSSPGNEVSYPLLDIEPDGTTTTTISLPTSGRFVISLNQPDQTEPLRTLVLAR